MPALRCVYAADRAAFRDLKVGLDFTVRRFIGGIMNRDKMGSKRSLSERHECRIQELRHERKSEGLRLEGLKKVLQTRLPADPPETREVRAA